MESLKKRPSHIHWSHRYDPNRFLFQNNFHFLFLRLSDGLHPFAPSISVRKSPVASEVYHDPHFDMSNYYVPSHSDRNSIAETNFVALGVRMKPKHRDSYTSLD